MVQEIHNPSYDEVFYLEKKIEDEINKRCKMIKGVRKVNALPEITWIDGVYFIGGRVMVETQRGFINVHLIHKSIKEEVNNIIKEHIPTEHLPSLSEIPVYIIK